MAGSEQAAGARVRAGPPWHLNKREGVLFGHHRARSAPTPARLCSGVRKLKGRNPRTCDVTEKTTHQMLLTTLPLVDFVPQLPSPASNITLAYFDSRFHFRHQKLSAKTMARSGVRPQRRRWALALLLLARPCVSHWHEEWEAGQTYSYPWYEQPWVSRVNTFYCDEDCAARLEVAPTVDREFKALVELLNQTTGGPRNPYRGAFEGLDE